MERSSDVLFASPGPAVEQVGWAHEEQWAGEPAREHPCDLGLTATGRPVERRGGPLAGREAVREADAGERGSEVAGESAG